jgi:hypothetical protein
VTETAHPPKPPGSSGPALPEPDSPPVRWYRRRAFLVVIGIVVVVATAVISDLPTSASRATDIQAETTVIGEINTDIAPCVFAVDEALTLYGRQTSDTVSSAQRAEVPGLLRDDQDACSLTDQSIYDLSDIESLGGSAGDRVGDALNTATVWTTSDALGAIETIQVLSNGPNAKARAQLLKYERLMAADKKKATAEIKAADKTLAANLPLLKLST